VQQGHVVGRRGRDGEGVGRAGHQRGEGNSAGQFIGALADVPHCGIWGAQRRHARPLTLTALFLISQSLTQLPNKSSGVGQATNPYDRPVPRLELIYVGITACSLNGLSTD
jgi:hypothetical protein